MLFCIIQKNKSFLRRSQQMSAYGPLSSPMSDSHTQQQGKQGKQILSPPFLYGQASLVAHKESACSAEAGPRFNRWVRKIPWRREWQPTPVSLPGEFHGQRSLVGYSPQGCRESDRIDRPNTSTSSIVSSKEFTCQCDVSLIPGQGISPGEGNDNPLQYSFFLWSKGFNQHGVGIYTVLQGSYSQQR